MKTLKLCNKCPNTFLVSIGNRDICNPCYKKEWSSRPENLEKKRRKSKAYRESNHGKEYNKAYYERNRQMFLEKSKKRRESSDRDELREYHRKYAKKYWNTRSKIDLDFKIRHYIRSRLRHAISKCQKKGSAVEDLGCSIEFLKKHLESKFQPGMSWDNWGRGENCWHIDHIKPLSKFDLTIPDSYRAACHYTNLQPLWEKDNLRKYNNG